MLIYCNKMNWDDERKQVWRSLLLYTQFYMIVFPCHFFFLVSILQQCSVVKEATRIWRGTGSEESWKAFKYQSKIYKLSNFMDERISSCDKFASHLIHFYEFKVVTFDYVEICYTKGVNSHGIWSYILPMKSILYCM